MNTTEHTQPPSTPTLRPIQRCIQVRHVLTERSLVRFGTGKTIGRRKAWETRRCGQYLWTEEHRQAGRCRSCLSGWAVAHNYPIEQPQPTVCSPACPWCSVGPYAPDDEVFQAQIRGVSSAPAEVAFHLVELSTDEINTIIDELQTEAADLRSTLEVNEGRKRWVAERAAELLGIAAKLTAARRGGCDAA